jgi:hypothetical protein
MIYPLFGKTWACDPERMTLTEAMKRENGRTLWHRASRALRVLGLL